MAKWWKIAAAAAVSAAAGTLAASYACYRMAFGVTEKQRAQRPSMPNAEQYDVWELKAQELMAEASAIEYEDVYIRSRDGLQLHGRFYRCGRDNAPIQIEFHGYRSSAMRDFCGGMQLALECGCDVLLVDQRAHGSSEGRSISFGVNERFDCAEWVKYAENRWKGRKIVLTGISMGAATVLMAAGLDLGENVVGVIADCGYSSPRAIIRKVIGELGYPVAAGYALTRLGGKIFGGFDIEDATATDALAHTKIPILFIHGAADDFVPHSMSVKNFEACASTKTLVSVPDAGHGISYLVDYPTYSGAVKEFIGRVTA